MREGVESLIIRRLLIRRMAGLESDLALKDFSPGVNVIYGPNGVGKSRTALALNIALWPKDIAAASRDAVSAEFEIGAEPWAVEVDAGDIRRHRGGVEADAPMLPAYDVRDRYNLALQDLLDDKGEDFARAIGRESAGGYDLAAAAQFLEIDRKPSARSSRETEALQSAMKQVQERRGELEKIQQREQELAEKKRQQEVCSAAAGHAPRLAAVRELIAATTKHAMLESRVAEFPPAIAQMTGRELDQLRQLRADIDTESKSGENAGRDRVAAEQMLADARLPDDAKDESIVQTLAELSRQMGELRGEIGIQERALDEARARRSTARQAIGPAIDDEKLARLDLKGINALAIFAREAELARADLNNAQAFQRWLAPRGSADPDARTDSGRLEEGVRLLAQWLRQPATVEAPESRWISAAAAAIFVLMAALLAWKWTLWAALLGVTGPALFLLSRRRARGAVIPDARPVFQQQYLALGFEPPAEWSAASVEMCHHMLWDRLASTKMEKERSDRLADARPLLLAAQQRVSEIGQKRQELFSRFGLAPSIDEPVLIALVEGVNRWQAAAESVAGAEASLGTLQRRYSALLASAAEHATALGYSITTPTELPGITEALRKRFTQRASAMQKIAQTRNAMEESDRRKQELFQRVTILFNDLGLKPEEEPTLRQWLAARDDHARAKRDLDISAAQIRDLQSRIGDATDLLAIPREQLEALSADALAQAEKEKSLLAEIAGIEKEIELARRRSDLEAAQADRREAAAALAASRAEDCEKAAGFALADYLRTVSRERHQSAVFRGARQLFARVTRGRYRLDIADGGEIPQFRCIDSNTGFGQSLDELSSGTRLQLLLCVRVAFVEQQEQGPKLPLILDETLANSDETRARQILDAIIEICRGGRQVFYFTAQPDEVGKWREVLEASGSDVAPPHKFIDLAAVRGLAAVERTPARQIITSPAPQVPSPAGMTREQYRTALEAPGIDPYFATAGSVHLWHLVDDLATLHQLLSMGIKTWGQWKTMADVGGMNGSIAAQAYSVAEARAALIETMGRLWRVGRGRQVDRQVLLDSGALSKKFAEPVIALASQLRGDTRLLITQLDDGAVSGFRQAALEKLRQYLQDNGYLDVRDPLPADELRLKTIGSVSREMQAGRLHPELIDEYMGTWFDGNAARAGPPGPH